MIIAGKMHGAGVDEPVADEESVKAMIDAGAERGFDSSSRYCAWLY